MHFFSLILEKFTPDRNFLHRHVCGVCDKYEVCSNAIYMNWVGCSEAFFLFSHICTNLGGWNFSMSYELNDILGSANIDQYICPKQDILVQFSPETQFPIYLQDLDTKAFSKHPLKECIVVLKEVVKFVSFLKFS